MALQTWTVSQMIQLWAVWIVGVVLMIAVTITPLLNSTAIGPTLFVVTPLGTASGWAGVALAAAQILVVSLAPVALLSGVWAWKRRGAAA